MFAMAGLRGFRTQTSEVMYLMGACSSLLHGVSAPHNLCAVVCRPATGAGFFLCLSRERNQREDTPRWRSGPPLAGRSPGGWRRARGRREGTSCPVTAGSAIRADPPLRAPPAAAPPRGRTERLVASRHRAKTQQRSVAMPRSGEPERSVPRARHPAGTMALVPLAVTKGTRAGRVATSGSAVVMKRGTREQGGSTTFSRLARSSKMAHRLSTLRGILPWK